MPLTSWLRSPGPRRTLLAFAVTFLAALAVFTLPRFVWNTVAQARAQGIEQPVSGRQGAQGAAATGPQTAAPAPTADTSKAPAPPATDTAHPSAPAGAALPRAARLIGLLGMALILAIGYALSRNRRAIRWSTIGWGLSLQVLFAIFVLRVPFGQRLFQWLGAVVTRILGFSYAGSSFVFGEIGKQNSSIGVVFAFQILPAIIFVSALFAILYYLGVMQVVVRAMAVAMHKLLHASGAESLNVAASIFMGQTEAPLTIRPFLNKMTRSELMTVMTAGMAHVSGAIMAAYIAFGIEARHLLTAVIMTAPGTILMAKLLEPETEQPETMGHVQLDIPKTDVNVVDAASRGTGEGLHLMLNVIAMLISFIAIVALLNGFFGWVHGLVAWFPGSLQVVLGWIGRPIAWTMGVSWADSGTVGALLGERAVLNEFIAFADLGRLRAGLDPRSFTIASFALCGFANISSVGIQIGGIGALAPERKHDLARLGFRAMLAGTLANFMSATIAGILL
ncbi:MAG: nucleoside transporter C-terminal domain-containing protein [Gemmatimonadales bacterium]|jgi:CNT family concentrative nucleoside transporter